MTNDIIRKTLSPSAGLGTQATKLADNVQSMKTAIAMLQHTEETVRSANPAARRQLEPLLATTVQPLLNLGQTASEDLEYLAARMRRYIDEISSTPSQVHGQSEILLSFVLKARFNSLQAQATAIQSAALNASKILTNFSDSANRASSTLNSFSEKLSQEDTGLENKVKDIQSKMHAMTSGNCCEQIGHSFQYVFGHLKSDLESAQRDIVQTEYVIAVNRKAVEGLTQMVGRMGNISAVASSLEISWRGIADAVGDLEADLATVLKGKTAAEIQSDLEYVKSDWQSIQSTLNKVA